MNSTKLSFTGFPEHDIYNITAPFHWREKTIIAGRVEKREEELSQIIFFEKSKNHWHPSPGVQSFAGLQDPCVTKINGKILLGGVRFPVETGGKANAWQMEFYMETEDGSFDQVLTGPLKMKDIRFLQLPDERILVLTRPQGEEEAGARLVIASSIHLKRRLTRKSKGHLFSIIVRRIYGLVPMKPIIFQMVKLVCSVILQNLVQMETVIIIPWFFRSIWKQVIRPCLK
jgi:hypothetical protein